MPNNRILWKDFSFVKDDSTAFKDYRTMSPHTWHAEEHIPNPQQTAFTKDLTFPIK
jgi:hypothetical protein